MAAKKKSARKRAPTKKMGRPTSFKPAFVNQARRLCQLGATDADLAECFGVVEATINTWKLAHPEFAEALAAGKAIPDDAVERSLYERAIGYSHEAVKIMSTPMGIVQTPFIERYPPDTTACIFWLKNRRKDTWRDRSEVEHDVTAGLAVALKAARERVQQG